MKIYKIEGELKKELKEGEIDEINSENRLRDIVERKRPLTESEIISMLIKEQINTITVDDQTSLRMKEFYPEWKTEMSVPIGYRLQYQGKLYKVITAHTTQADWTPDVSITLFERIDETHDGSKYDPIPYDGNMVLENGKYYTQYGVKYICTRDTENPVYHALKDLIGIYVDVVTE